MFSQASVILFRMHPLLDAPTPVDAPPTLDAAPLLQKTDSQQAVGTHPSGMHTCFSEFYKEVLNWKT